MTVEEPKKGRVAAAILAGSALTFSSFAIGTPAAFADTGDSTFRSLPFLTSVEDEEDETGNDNTSGDQDLDDGAGGDDDTSSDQNDSETGDDDGSGDENDGDVGDDDASADQAADEEDSEPDSSNDSEEPAEEDDEGDENGTDSPSLELEETEVAQGDSLQITGAGFEPETSIKLVATHEDGKFFEDTTSTDAADEETPGSFRVSLDIPEDAELGDYKLVATSESEASAKASFVVIAGDEGDESPIPEGPQISLQSNEVYQGGALEVEVSNLTPEGDVSLTWNPTDITSADADGNLITELPIAEDAEPGVHELTVRDVTANESTTVEYTVLAAPALFIAPEEITLDEFIGDPDEGAGVVHVVQGMEPGAEITYAVTGPEGVNDFEDSDPAEEDGVLEFVIHGFEGVNPEVYLGDYITVVTFENADGETEELTGSFSVVTGDEDEAGAGEDETDDVAEPAAGTSADLNGTSLAETGATSGQLALIAGGLLLAGGAFVVFANRARLFGRKH